MSFTKYVQTHVSGNTITIHYQPYGKILWVKDPNNGNILQVKSVGMHLDPNMNCWLQKQKDGIAAPINEYLLADGRETNGTAQEIIMWDANGNEKIAKLYDTFNECLTLNGNIGHIHYSDLDIFELLRDEYGAKFHTEHYGWCSIVGYKMVNGICTSCLPKFTIFMDADGFQIIVEEFDERTAFPTKEMAMATYKPKIYTFDNHCVDTADDMAEIVEIKVKITKGKLESMRRLGLV